MFVVEAFHCSHKFRPLVLQAGLGQRRQFLRNVVAASDLIQNQRAVFPWMSLATEPSLTFTVSSRRRIRFNTRLRSPCKCVPRLVRSRSSRTGGGGIKLPF